MFDEQIDKFIDARKDYYRRRIIGDIVVFIFFAVVGVFYFLYNYIYKEKLMLAILSFAICIIGLVLIYISKTKLGEVKTFEQFITKPSPEKGYSYISNKYITPEYIDDYVTDSLSWYSNKYFYLDFDRKPSLVVNKERAYEYVKKCPFYIRIPHMLFTVIAALSFAFCLFAYKPVFNAIMDSDLSSSAKDICIELQFWGPCILCLVCGLCVFITTILRLKAMKKLCKIIVDENITISKYSDLFTEKRNNLNNRWYYNNCPKCRRPAKEGESYCDFCDEYLLIKDYKNVYQNNRHQIIRDYSKKQITEFEKKYPSGL